MSLFLLPGIDDQNVSDDPVLNLARSVDRVVQQLNLANMSHKADLLWIIGELKGTLASWGDTEILNEVTKERVQHLVATLGEKIREEI